jgi:hypothetical protein
LLLIANTEKVYEVSGVRPITLAALI